jgi:hypothetical protein
MTAMIPPGTGEGSGLPRAAPAAPPGRGRGADLPLPCGPRAPRASSHPWVRGEECHGHRGGRCARGHRARESAREKKNPGSRCGPEGPIPEAATASALPGRWPGTGVPTLTERETSIGKRWRQIAATSLAVVLGWSNVSPPCRRWSGLARPRSRPTIPRFGRRRSTRPRAAPPRHVPRRNSGMSEIPCSSPYRMAAAESRAR